VKERRYLSPQIISYQAKEVVDLVGPCQTAYEGFINVEIGATAFNNSKSEITNFVNKTDYQLIRLAALNTSQEDKAA